MNMIEKHSFEEDLHKWQEELLAILIKRHGEKEGQLLSENFGKVLAAGYIQEVSPAIAANDIQQIAGLKSLSDLRLSLQYLDIPNGRSLRLKLYRKEFDIPLSDVLPLMENMGLRVLTEHPYRLQIDNEIISIQDFEVESPNLDINIEKIGHIFEDALLKVWNGDAENDGFNRLTLAANLEWQHVAMLRGYCKYLLQVGIPFSQPYMEATLIRYPVLARLLVALFEGRFNPDITGYSKDELQQHKQRLSDLFLPLCKNDEISQRKVQAVIDALGQKRDVVCQVIHENFVKLLDKVSSLDEDRILRGFMSAIEATLRTSFYQLNAEGQTQHCISFKFNPALVADIPKPCPYREIFVYSPRVEGTHLRFGAVARGGLRWSDRREDFRTEVLGLVKAQMVKNTIIVPVGAKGGFIPKRLPVNGDRDAVFAEGIACYKLFIQGLLDITDNIVDGKIVPPPHVVRHDDDDPYLVVAADKGTATFSDTANGLALAHGFWMGDAFASGGSVGYDHKGMGITARGAWESVKRHFRSLGIDCQTQDFTCVGIGDMSGDVFGNGMRLSQHTRLLVAFDHRHIFLDPNPDAAASFVERDRLFKVPRSSWADYNAELISKGGGIYARTLKSIEITPEVREVLGLSHDVAALSPTDLIQAALRAPVDLVWNGGIGTYIKGSSETHADVGDRANNAVRVNGRDLRCKIIGEGGNLGMTQLGRIEAALSGVILNTDFIDNSAGVGTSDHEVNIKILLNAAVLSKKLTLEDRNTLLRQMTSEVADLVLHDNYRQNQTLSLMERMSASRIGSKQHFIHHLESQGKLNRALEYLPSDAEFTDRRANSKGLTRPELAVLLSYSKLVAFQEMVDSDIPEDSYLSKELQRYFPTPLQENYASYMETHRLKREIIATAVTNSTINRMGATFLFRMQEDTGRSSAEVAKAYTITRETLDARDLWGQIDALDGIVPESVQIDALQVIWGLQRSLTRWLLNRPGAIPDIATAVSRYHDGFKDIRAANGVLPDSMRPAYNASLAEWLGKNVPAELATQLAALPYLEPCCDIIEVALARKLKPVDVAKIHYRLGDALRLPWLFTQIDALQVDGRWHAVARGVLRDELASHQRNLVGQVLSQTGDGPDAKVEQWLKREDVGLRFTLSMLNEIAAQDTLDYPTVSVAVQRLGQLAAQG